jgi:hypothetical protein
VKVKFSSEKSSESKRARLSLVIRPPAGALVRFAKVPL